MKRILLVALACCFAFGPGLSRASADRFLIDACLVLNYDSETGELKSGWLSLENIVRADEDGGQQAQQPLPPPSKIELTKEELARVDLNLKTAERVDIQRDKKIIFNSRTLQAIFDQLEDCSLDRNKNLQPPGGHNSLFFKVTLWPIHRRSP